MCFCLYEKLTLTPNKNKIFTFSSWTHIVFSLTGCQTDGLSVQWDIFSDYWGVGTMAGPRCLSVYGMNGAFAKRLCGLCGSGNYC